MACELCPASQQKYICTKLCLYLIINIINANYIACKEVQLKYKNVLKICLKSRFRLPSYNKGIF